MSSATSPVREALDGYLAGRVQAERLVAVVAEAYFGETGSGKWETLRPVVEVIERVSPGAVELARVEGGAGFDVRPRERGVAKQHEAELRAAVEAALRGWGMGDAERAAASPGLLRRLARALRSLFR